MSTRDLNSSINDNAISPAQSMMSSGSPQYHRLSKIETDDEHNNFDTSSSVATSSTTLSGAMQVIAGAVQQTVADVSDAMAARDDTDEDNETDSLVDEMMLQHRPASRGGSIFRAGEGGGGGSHRGAPAGGSWTPSSLGSIEVPGASGNVNAASSRRVISSPLQGHAHSPLSTTDNVDEDGGDDAIGGSSSNNNSKSMTVGLSASHSSSVEWEDYDDDDDDFDDDDADAVVRRYHHIVAVSKVPSLPAEFSHQRSIPKRIWQSFLELRAAARQRRAARLLTLPSESAWSYDVLQACFMTWCCDATDRGIALVAVLLFLWLVIGMTAGTMSSTYWWMGVLLFTMRVSARRGYELFVRKRHQHHHHHLGGRTHRLSADSMEMSIASSSKKASSSSVPKAYRDQSEPQNII
jgi:hypothetical protein